MPRAFRALSHPEFRLIWISYLVGQGGFWLAQVTVQVMVVGLSGGDPLRQSLVVVAFFAPQLIFSPIAGVLADRYDRVSLMAFAEAGLAVLACLLAILTLTGHAGLIALTAISAGLGAAYAVLGPTGLAVAGQAVPVEDLASAVALQSVANNLARMVGPALAVPVVLLGGPTAAFVGFAVFAAATVVLLLRVRTARLPHPSSAGFVASLREGFAHAAERPPTLLLLAMVLVSSLLTSSFVNVLGPVLAVAVLHEGAKGYFVLVVAAGAGAAVGAMATGFQVGPPRLRTMVIEMVALGGVLAVAGETRSYEALVIATAVYGGVFFALMASIATTIQHLVDEGSRGRVMSLYALAWGGVMPLGALLLGFFAHNLGVATTLLAAGLLVISFPAAIGAFVLLRRLAGFVALRRAPQQTPGQSREA